MSALRWNRERYPDYESALVGLEKEQENWLLTHEEKERLQEQLRVERKAREKVEEVLRQHVASMSTVLLLERMELLLKTLEDKN